MAVLLEPGTIIADRYRLDRVLGQGGMGVVWAATHAITRRTVAMKFIRTTLQEKAELRRRLLREAHAAAAVRHPNVVDILDVFELDAETPVIVMTLLHGETLGQRLAREPPLSLAEAASILLPAISAIGTAHARGVVHRDLKPDNIYLSEASGGTVVKVLDFGIAKLLSADQAPEDSIATQTGSTLGTPSYMAPEQAAGENDVDHRADVWALGVIAYESFSGMRPIEGDNAGQVIMRLMTTGITPLARVTRGLPDEVTSLVDRMLARDRARRCPDLLEVQRVLSRHTNVTAPQFGPPGSELSTAFERDFRRSSAPVVMSPRVPAEVDSDTLVEGRLPTTEAVRTFERRPTARLIGWGALAAASVLGLSAWRLATTRAPDLPGSARAGLVVSVTPPRPAAAEIDATPRPSASIRAEEARAALTAELAAPQSSASKKRPPVASGAPDKPASAKEESTLPELAVPSASPPLAASQAAVSTPAPSSGGPASAPTRRPGGIVVVPPF